MGTMLDTAGDPAATFRGLSFDAIAAYANGRYANYAAARKAFPRLRCLEIDVSGAGVGNTGDFEPGDMSYDHAGRWAAGRLAAGVWRPVVYFSVSNWQAVMSSLQASGVARSDVRIWTAHYNGREHLCTPACNRNVTGTADATQWASPIQPGTLPAIYAHRNLDVSKTNDGFWGVQPAAPQFQRELKVGSRGHPVEIWQQQMRLRGWHIVVNGAFDASCETVCRAFQKEKGLKVTGTVNNDTWNAAWTEPITN